MTCAWLLAPHEYEPDCDAYWRDVESLQDAMADVATYADWFPEQDDTTAAPRHRDTGGNTCALNA